MTLFNTVKQLSFMAFVVINPVKAASFTTVQMGYTAVCRDKYLNDCTVYGPTPTSSAVTSTGTTTTLTVLSTSTVTTAATGTITITDNACTATCYDYATASKDHCDVTCVDGFTTEIPIPTLTTSRATFTTAGCTAVVWDERPGVGADLLCHGSRYDFPVAHQTHTDDNGCAWICDNLNPGIECQGNCPTATFASFTHNLDTMVTDVPFPQKDIVSLQMDRIDVATLNDVAGDRAGAMPATKGYDGFAWINPMHKRMPAAATPSPFALTSITTTVLPPAVVASNIASKAASSFAAATTTSTIATASATSSTTSSTTTTSTSISVSTSIKVTSTATHHPTSGASGLKDSVSTGAIVAFLGFTAVVSSLMLCILI